APANRAGGPADGAVGDGVTSPAADSAAVRVGGAVAVTDGVAGPAADSLVAPSDRAAALAAGADSVQPPTALVANLPYNVAVPVVLHLLAELPGIRRGLIMVQAEVAERLAAAPGSRAYGVPSVKLAWFA